MAVQPGIFCGLINNIIRRYVHVRSCSRKARPIEDKGCTQTRAGEGEFLIQVLASSICNATDNHIVEGIFDGYHDHYPQTLGHEVCGGLLNSGEGVQSVKVEHAI